MSSSAYGPEFWLAVAAGLAIAAGGALARAQPGAGPRPPQEPPQEPPEEEIAPPPDRPGYAPDPLLGGGRPVPGQPPPQPPPPQPMIGPVPRSPDGTFPLVQWARYRADLLIDAPAWLINEAMVENELEGVGFNIESVQRLSPQQFRAIGTRTGPSGRFAEPDRVTVEELERTA